MSSASEDLSPAEFGAGFLQLALTPERVCEAVNRVMGDRLELGPMGAGPGRVLAKITTVAVFGTAYGEAIPDADLAYRVMVPVSAAVDLDLSVDTLHFTADVLVPLDVRVAIDPELALVFTITPPPPDEVTLSISTETRRAAMLLRVANLDDELRAFVVRIVEKELTKPHVVRATRIDLRAVVDGAWPVIAEQVLPNGPDNADEQVPA